eukprot:CAMPEP_0174916808 /NCGR_PEP_ID=MMETSP1355-20121228/2059_1 /TAXON_ID=464990 /ORGANISM="Hemiselmis tepida, Strain CCMP443" /LENGTH=201 /DNA_ID=CAMNT_0016161845 /DNA_START=8 /DNA_END=613 /DNA_ORIENTATION=-
MIPLPVAHTRLSVLSLVLLSSAGGSASSGLHAAGPAVPGGGAVRSAFMAPLAAPLRGPSRRVVCRGPESRGSGLCMADSDAQKRFGAASDYMKKIPSHLQGLAIRKQNPDLDSKRTGKDKREYTGEAINMDDIKSIADEIESYDEDQHMYADLAMNMLDEEIDVRAFDGDINDAELLKDLKSKMDPEDFREIFGKGLGELL